MRASGLSRIETLIILTLVAILSAIAIPTIARTVRRSRTSEAAEKLAYMFRAASTYYESERVDQDAARVGECVPRTSKTLPAVPRSRPRQADFSQDPTFSQIDFSSSDPVYFSYTFVGIDRCRFRGGPAFTARAEGNLDDDSTKSLFERAARATAQGEIEGTSGLYVQQKSE
ncbi:MAG: hypothetical protein HYY06_00950 [Deltaproteobacteria bacterium]|nr:hypothetical protein [Deltaproteobacteria bacterium]